MTVQTCFIIIVELRSEYLGMGFRFFSSTTKLVTNAPPFLASLHPIDPPNIFLKGLHFSTFHMYSVQDSTSPFLPSQTALFTKTNFVDDVNENSESPVAFIFFST